MGIVGWLFLLILVVFVAICAKRLSRVWLVFAGSSLLRICGVMLFVASVFVALTAAFGGIALVLGFDKFPADWLNETAFRSYLIPGLILAVVVGGSATVAAVVALRRAGTSAVIAMLAGAILLGWLVGERVILPSRAFVPQFWWLEALYVAVGLMMVVPAVAVWLVVHWRTNA